MCPRRVLPLFAVLALVVTSGCERSGTPNGPGRTTTTSARLSAEEERVVREVERAKDELVGGADEGREAECAPETPPKPAEAEASRVTCATEDDALPLGNR